MPGVHAVLTHEDVPGEKTYGLEFADQPVLAIDRVRYHGEASRSSPPSTRSRRGARPSAIRRRVGAARDRRPTWSARPSSPSSTPTGRRTATATARTRGRTSSGRSSSGTATRPRAATSRSRASTRPGSRTRRSSGPSPGLAVPDGEGGVDIHVATQWLHVDRAQVAPCLGLPPEQVRIHLAGVGGAFGGREDLSMQIHAALLALHTSRAVKIVYNREESFVGHVHRHPSRIWARHTATREGQLVIVRDEDPARRRRLRLELDRRRSNAAAFAVGPYQVPNALLEATVVYTNNPPCGAMRGFGAVQTCFAAEAQMDKLADALGDRPRRAAAAERARAGRHAPDRPGGRGLAARPRR